VVDSFALSGLTELGFSLEMGILFCTKMRAWLTGFVVEDCRKCTMGAFNMQDSMGGWSGGRFRSVVQVCVPRPGMSMV
jgi:hypothetical protein